MQAIMLAAGMGKRLAKYTQNNTKCMVEVAGEKLIDRAIESIKKAGIKKFIIVLGYKGNNLKKYILEKYPNDLEYVFINNDVYDKTNNIYSFYLAKNELIKDDTILLESDLIFEKHIISDIVQTTDKNCVAIAKYESWMDGTCVGVDDNDFVNHFYEKKDLSALQMSKLYKTVNIYKFSKEFMTRYYLPFLEAYMASNGLNSYYETSLKFLCMLPDSKLKAFYMNNTLWYEIDDSQDLEIADILFSHGEEKYEKIINKYGGYWRYSKFIDFCYLVNPYFPTSRMIDKMKFEFPTLLSQHPSGLNVQNMNVERLYGVCSDYIVVGNGAAELINALGHVTTGKIGVNVPTFNEYIRCFNKCEIYEIDNSNNDYSLSSVSIKKAIDECNIVVIVNPENPSGFMFDKDELISICDYAKFKNKKLIIDESFIDFASTNKKYTLITNEFLEQYPNIIVIKSISKSYGVPGLRLGLLASSDIKLLNSLKNDLPIWNVNSFAEYYLQIFNLYHDEYINACKQIVNEREYLIAELSKIKTIKIYPSEANYVMIDLKSIDSHRFCVELLDKARIIIKDLSNKKQFKNKNFIRIAIRNHNDNQILIKYFKQYFGDNYP